MSTNIANRTPYLITSREFPSDPDELLVHLGKAYIDTATAVNARTIGIFGTGSRIITGEGWYLRGGNQKQQTLREVYSFNDSILTFNHNVSGAVIFTRIYGFATNGTIFFPIPYVSPTAANQIGISVSATQVVVTKGGSAPAITNGYVVLEWLSAV